MAEIGGQTSSCVSQCFVAFWVCLFRACDLLVVLPDGWDRYAGCATSSFEVLLVEQGSQVCETRRARDPTLRYIRCVNASGEAILSLHPPAGV